MDRLACIDVPSLRAANAVGQCSKALVELLQRFSPRVETIPELPGTFWLNATGLVPLYPTLAVWLEALEKAVHEAGLRAAVVIGFTRFGSWALARSAQGRRRLVLESAGREREEALRVPLACLEIDPVLYRLLAKLGVRTVGTFLRLPAAGLCERFGPEAYRLHRFAAGAGWTAPARIWAIEEPWEERALLDEAVTDVVHLLVLVRRLLDPLLERLATSHLAVSALYLLLLLDTRESLIETVQPAAVTLDARVLLELVELRLHATRLPAGVVEITLRIEAVEASPEQLRLFTGLSRRDLAAGERALARIRAELGEKAVVRGTLREGHLPEAGFFWERFAGLRPARPRRVASRPLIRRIVVRPIPLPPRPTGERNDHWLAEMKVGPVLRALGPYIVSGGWWVRAVHREYFFVETRRGDLLWVYYDRPRRRWFLQGRVE